MATLAEFTVDSGGFPLGVVFEDLPNAVIELERIVPASGTIVPYFWVVSSEGGDIEAALNKRPEVQSTKVVDKIDDEYLVRVEWDAERGGLLQAIDEADVTLLSATGTQEEWTFEIRGDDRDAISTFQSVCRDQEIPIELTGLHALAPMRSGTEYNLTDGQRKALILAYERGFFRSPREVTLEELADELGITGQSLGERIRRGTHRLIGSTLAGP